jgi:hypothetical protein
MVLVVYPSVLETLTRGFLQLFHDLLHAVVFTAKRSLNSVPHPRVKAFLL